MKILGKSDNAGMFIVQISENELANFMGLYDFYAASKQPGMPLEPEKEIEVGECFKEAKEIIEMHQNANKAAAKLKDAASRFLKYFN